MTTPKKINPYYAQLNWICSIALAVFIGGFMSQFAWYLFLNKFVYTTATVQSTEQSDLVQWR